MATVTCVCNNYSQEITGADCEWEAHVYPEKHSEAMGCEIEHNGSFGISCQAPGCDNYLEGTFIVWEYPDGVVETIDIADLSDCDVDGMCYPPHLDEN